MHLKENQPGVAESKSQIMGIDLERRPYPRLLADTAGEKVLGGFEPDGDWIYYSESRADDYACRRISVSRPLEGHSCDLFCSAIGLYQWRDGKKWVYFRQNKGGYDIFLYDSASQKEAQLTAWSTHEAFPVFSRDGRKIFFHSYRDKKYRLYAIDLDEAASRDELLLLLNELNKQPLQSRAIVQCCPERDWAAFYPACCSSLQSPASNVPEPDQNRLFSCCGSAVPVSYNHPSGRACWYLP